MTTGLVEDPVPIPPLTSDEVAVVMPCPVCATPSGTACEHVKSRHRAALRFALTLAGS